MADENPPKAEAQPQPVDQSKTPDADAAPKKQQPAEAQPGILSGITDRLERIGSMRGALYRVITDQMARTKVGKGPEAENVEKTKKPAEPEMMALPGFRLKNVKPNIDFPKYDDISQIDITYPLIEPFAYANIKWDSVNKELVYNVIQPELDDKDRQMIKKISEALIELVEVELTSIKEEGKIIEYLEKQIAKILRQFGLDLPPAQYARIMYFIYRNFVGFNEIEPFLQDPNIEDISCDGTGAPMYARGPTFTIRKFSERPFSPIDVINSKTISSPLMAYFWYLIEYGASILVVGGVATGKTSFLNSICMFIPPESKIVSIEDTRELRIPNEHWVPTLARVGFGIPLPGGEKYGGVSLFDLLKQSFRQNPDYVIVGETRGPEAYVMFQGMSSGHPSMSTFHGGSVDSVVKRLTTPPIDLSPTLIESLNVIAVMVHAREKGKSARRMKEVTEIISVDPKTAEVKTNVVFTWDPVADRFLQLNTSIMVRKLVEAKGGSAEDAAKEIKQRTRVLEWMRAQGITDFAEVTKIINRYYKEPKVLMAQIGAFQTPKDAEIKIGKIEELHPLPMQPEVIIENEAEPLRAVEPVVIPRPAILPRPAETVAPPPVARPQPQVLVFEPVPVTAPPEPEPVAVEPEPPRRPAAKAERPKPLNFMAAENPLDSMAKEEADIEKLAAEGKMRGGLAGTGEEEAAKTGAQIGYVGPFNGTPAVLGLFNFKFVKEMREQLKRELRNMAAV
ncbi:MAG: ATPase, T2SS/T4P/T4SS family [Candidatus Aenigmarchaeota archaeon]|nr:ATPase, T2SS/T4P/T4SS family [Candidatus Aenigmarchaeota archaeon]